MGVVALGTGCLEIRIGATLTSPGLGCRPSCHYHSRRSKLRTFATAGSGRFYREEVGAFFFEVADWWHGGNHKKPRNPEIFGMSVFYVLCGRGVAVSRWVFCWNHEMFLCWTTRASGDGIALCDHFHPFHRMEHRCFRFISFETRNLCSSKKVITHPGQSPYPTLQPVGTGVFQRRV